MNLAEEVKEAQPIFVSFNLLIELKKPLIDLLKEYKDIFFYTYAELLGLDSQLVRHQLIIRE